MARSYSMLSPGGKFVKGEWEARAPIYLEASKATAQIGQAQREAEMRDALAREQLAQQQGQFTTGHDLDLRKQALAEQVDRGRLEHDIAMGRGRLEHDVEMGRGHLGVAERGATVGERGATVGERGAETREKQQELEVEKHKWDIEYGKGEQARKYATAEANMKYQAWQKLHGNRMLEEDKRQFNEKTEQWYKKFETHDIPKLESELETAKIAQEAALDRLEFDRDMKEIRQGSEITLYNIQALEEKIRAAEARLQEARAKGDRPERLAQLEVEGKERQVETAEAELAAYRKREEAARGTINPQQRAEFIAQVDPVLDRLKDVEDVWTLDKFGARSYGYSEENVQTIESTIEDAFTAGEHSGLSPEHIAHTLRFSPHIMNLYNDSRLEDRWHMGDAHMQRARDEAKTRVEEMITKAGASRTFDEGGTGGGGGKPGKGAKDVKSRRKGGEKGMGRKTAGGTPVIDPNVTEALAQYAPGGGAVPLGELPGAQVQFDPKTGQPILPPGGGSAMPLGKRLVSTAGGKAGGPAGAVGQEGVDFWHAPEEGRVSVGQDGMIDISGVPPESIRWPLKLPDGSSVNPEDRRINRGELPPMPEAPGRSPMMQKYGYSGRVGGEMMYGRDYHRAAALRDWHMKEYMAGRAPGAYGGFAVPAGGSRAQHIDWPLSGRGATLRGAQQGLRDATNLEAQRWVRPSPARPGERPVRYGTP